MKQSNAVAYLRQLCCSGLPCEIVIREFLFAVKAVISSDNNVYIYCNNQWIPREVIFANLSPELFPVAAEIIPNYYNAERRACFIDWFNKFRVLADPRIYDQNFYNSDFYHLIWRTNDQHYCMQSPITQNWQVIGSPCLLRSRRDKPFSNQEQLLFSRLMPYLSHAVQDTQKQEIKYCDGGNSGMMVFTTVGKLLYLDDDARELLDWACYPAVAMAKRFSKDELLARLGQLCRDLNAIYQSVEAAPPSFSHTNSRGRFSFRGQWLSRNNREPGHLVGINIRHEVPVLLKILRGLQQTALSSSQKEVAALIAQGLSNEKIGKALHIKLSTVKDHINKIYTKLDVHQRDELVAKLMALDTSADNKNLTIISKHDAEYSH
jgi:DNA-binding CsgD family transcriptional regulator